MLRSLIKTGSSHALHVMRIAKQVRDIKRVPVVLGYHRVVEDFTGATKHSIPSMLISRQTLERHLDWLGQHFQFVSLDELGAVLAGGGSFKHPVAAITFDDGYADVYENAFPILRRKGIPAAVFVVTELIDNPQPYLHDQLYWMLCESFSRWESPRNQMVWLLRDLGVDSFLAGSIADAARNPFAAARELLVRMAQRDIRRIADALKDHNRPAETLLDDMKPLNREMLVTMHRSGITIGSHTRTHVLLTNETQRRVQDELRQSRNDLETMLGVPVRHFAYPDGRFNNRVVQAVAAAGYRYGYGTCGHLDADYPLLTIPRRVLWEGSSRNVLGSFSPAILDCQITGLFDLANRCVQDHGSPKRTAAHFSESRKVGLAS